MTHPRMAKIKQNFRTDPINNISDEIHAEFIKCEPKKVISPGQSVAITAGSRGINNIALIIKALVDELKMVGSKPFVVPAMGSHGSATAQGQKKVLERYGITEDALGVPIKSSMEVYQIGETLDGIPVLMDKNALQADHIFVVNRVKPHTDFEGDIESGLMKMIAIGLGKQKAADHYHNMFMQRDHCHVITSVARIAIANCKIAFGLAIVENQKDETQIIKIMPTNQIEKEEKKLLISAKKLLPRIPFDPIDILIVNLMGKTFSGTGMDQNVIARTVVPYHKVPSNPKIGRIIVRGLSNDSCGNALGIGNADFTTQRLIDKIDRGTTYMNVITSSCPELIRIPPYYDCDCEILEAVYQTLPEINPSNARIVHIENTLMLENMYISETLIIDARKLKNISMVGTPVLMEFDENGNIDYSF